ncbi:MAG TPA: polyketide synthase, partial [Ktedonobacteraceae bacterium]
MSNTPENAKNLSAEQRALLALRRMRTRLEALEREKSEPIALIGMSCRFPGKANTPESFWQLLKDGRDAVTRPPTKRWDIDAYFERDPALAGRVPTQWSGFLEDVEQFDAAFFGISPREADYMDPQQRFLLEVAWEALENAGQPIQQLAGSLTGVFVGMCNLDYDPTASFDPVNIDPYYSTGSTYSVAAGRIAYMFDFLGPCISVDT